MSTFEPMFANEFLDCDESTIDVETELDDLDAHFCPVCRWSFRARKPRMLRCGHAFYFCERCLKFKNSIRCSSCGVITELSKQPKPEFSIKRPEPDKIENIQETQTSQEKVGPSSPVMDYIQRNRELSRQLEALSKEQEEWREKSTLFLSSRAEVQMLKERNEELEHQLMIFRNENERLVSESESSARRMSDLEREMISIHSPRRSLEKRVEDLQRQLAEKTEIEQSLLMELADVRQQLTQSETRKQVLERKQFDLETRFNSMKVTRTDQTTLLFSRLTHMSESIQELRTEIAFIRKELPHSVGRYGKWVAVEMSNLVRKYGRSQEKMQQIQTAYERECKLRRKYFNIIQELKGNIRVYCRIRPVLPSEFGPHFDAEGYDPVALTPANLYCARVHVPDDPKRNKTFEYDRVFGPQATQEDVFEDTRQLVTSVLDGYDVCIFAYGQTGSGKTHTMEGPAGDRGIYFRAIDELFQVIATRSEDWHYELKMSMLEIYNERIRDLLNNRPVDSVDIAKQNQPVYLNLHERPNGTVFADGVTWWEASSVADVHRALRNGAANRSVGVTNMNEHSSRSHSILTIEAVGRNNKTNEEYLGKLNLIDLAGSERINRSGARGQQLQEAMNINKSLSALGNVIEALKKKSSHVPFRDSKLTFLLQNSLAGHSKTLMFVNVSPLLMDVDESICSLNFANRVRNTALGQASRHVRHKGAEMESPAPITPFTARTQTSFRRSKLRSAPAHSKSVSFVHR